MNKKMQIPVTGFLENCSLEFIQVISDRVYIFYFAVYHLHFWRKKPKSSLPFKMVSSNMQLWELNFFTFSSDQIETSFTNRIDKI